MDGQKYYTFDEVLKIVRESLSTNKRYFRRKGWEWYHNDFPIDKKDTYAPYINFEEMQANDWYEV